MTSTTALFSRPVASKARIELDNVENPMAKKKKKSHMATHSLFTMCSLMHAKRLEIRYIRCSVGDLTFMVEVVEVPKSWWGTWALFVL